jgi:hypothetical protein
MKQSLDSAGPDSIVRPRKELGEAYSELQPEEAEILMPSLNSEAAFDQGNCQYLDANDWSNKEKQEAINISAAMQGDAIIETDPQVGTDQISQSQNASEWPLERGQPTSSMELMPNSILEDKADDQNHGNADNLTNPNTKKEHNKPESPTNSQPGTQACSDASTDTEPFPQSAATSDESHGDQEPGDDVDPEKSIIQEMKPEDREAKEESNIPRDKDLAKETTKSEVSQDENDSQSKYSTSALASVGGNFVSLSPSESQSEEMLLYKSSSINQESLSVSNVDRQDDWNEGADDEEEKEDEDLKAIQSTDENPDTETSFSASGESSDTTIGTEEAGTDTTSDTEDSLSTDENGAFLQDDDNEQHLIMPQQPDITRVAAISLDASPRSNAEEEKTEVDEYNVPEDSVHLEVILHLSEPPPSPQPMDFDGGAHSVPPVIENTRAEYVSITVLKLDATDLHGLEFMLVDRELRVSCIHPEGLFANSPLAAFDKILRINDLNVENLDPANASHLLDVLTGSVTMIAQNPGGVPDLVESLITKPLSDSQLGLELVDVCRDENLGKTQLEIARIGQKSLFSPGLLHVGDVVVAINNSHDVDMHTGNLLLSTAPRECVILARTKLKTQMAIARRPTHQLPPGFNIVRAMEEARRQREELRRKQGCYYNSCEKPGAAANIFQWLSNVYVTLVVLVVVGRTWQSIKKENTEGSDSVGTVIRFAILFLVALIIGFLVNAPWWYRDVGVRFSIAQLVCNGLVVAGLIVLVLVVGDYLIFAFSCPLLIIVNLPSVFVKRDYGSDGHTISDRSPFDDDMSKESDMA